MFLNGYVPQMGRAVLQYGGGRGDKICPHAKAKLTDSDCFGSLSLGHDLARLDEDLFSLGESVIAEIDVVIACGFRLGAVPADLSSGDDHQTSVATGLAVSVIQPLQESAYNVGSARPATRIASRLCAAVTPEPQ